MWVHRDGYPLTLPRRSGYPRMSGAKLRSPSAHRTIGHNRRSYHCAMRWRSAHQTLTAVPLLSVWLVAALASASGGRWSSIPSNAFPDHLFGNLSTGVAPFCKNLLATPGRGRQRSPVPSRKGADSGKGCGSVVAQHLTDDTDHQAQSRSDFRLPGRGGIIFYSFGTLTWTDIAVAWLKSSLNDGHNVTSGCKISRVTVCPQNGFAFP